jgi:hypothetical protein
MQSPTAATVGAPQLISAPSPEASGIKGDSGVCTEPTWPACTHDAEGGLDHKHAAGVYRELRGDQRTRCFSYPRPPCHHLIPAASPKVCCEESLDRGCDRVQGRRSARGAYVCSISVGQNASLPRTEVFVGPVRAGPRVFG